MFNLFGRKRREEKPTPPWLVWLVIIFLGYSMLAGQRQGSPTQRSVEQAKEHLQTRGVFDLEGFGAKLFPDSAPGLRSKDVAPGSGPAAVCGQTLSVAYSAEFGNGVAAAEKADATAPLMVTLGERKAPALFEQGLIGMKKGGKRTLIAPLSFTSFDEKQSPGLGPDTPVKVEAELLSLSPDLPGEGGAPLRVFVGAPGTGAAARCGDAVNVRLTLWSVAGKKLYETAEPLAFTLGKSEVFFGLEQAVQGLRAGGKASAIVPPAYQHTLTGGEPAAPLPFPKDETVLAEVELLP